MSKQKIVHTLYSGLGGHSAVVFPFLESSHAKEFKHILVFYGVESVAASTRAYVKKIDQKSHYLPKKRGQYLKPFRQFKKLLQKYEPAAIIIHNSELLIPALTYRKKHKHCSVIYVEHQDQDKKGILLRRLSKIAANQAQSVVCLNANSREELLRNYRYRCPIHVIPNGINTDLFIPKSSKKSEINVLGMASRMVKGKDHPTLLEAFSLVLNKHPHLRLKIAGDGPTLNTIKHLAEKLSIANQVDFMERIDEADMPDFYRGIDLYIQASFAETLCTSILQAFATKILVIASDIPNNCSLLNDGRRGLIYKSENPTSLAEQITTVIENPTAFDQYIQSGYEAVQERYNADHMSQRYKQLIKGDFNPD